MLNPADLEDRVETLFDELVRQQERKVLGIALELRPSVTRDDLLQPQDLPEVASDPTFNYEDGLLAGLRAARMAIRARLLAPLRPPGVPPGMKMDMVHSFACSRATYEERINDPELLRMCEGRLPYLKSRLLVESREGPGPTERFWRFRCEADYKMPEAARKLLGDNLGWFEESVFDRKEHLVRFKVLPDFFKGRYRCEGDQHFVERDDGGFDRLMTIELEVGILLVGRMIEKHILERLRETYEVEHEIQNEFFAKLRAAP